MNKREFIKTGLAGVAGLIAYPLLPKAGLSASEMTKKVVETSSGKFELPSLPYSYSALEPYIDARTMEIHHSRHHAGYVNNFNSELEHTGYGTSLESVMRSISDWSVAVRNNGGGHYNHKLFWEIMSPSGTRSPEGELREAINSSFGSFNAFKDIFASAAATRFGSGWAWLVVSDGKLKVTSTPNQDNPLMDVVPADERGTPVLGIDVWEHAYYLKYQNRRGDYISSFMNVVDWGAVAEKYAEATRV